MSVPARPKLRDHKLGRRREARGSRSTDRPDSGAQSRDTAASVTHRRREAGPPQDQALYSCHCGFVFAAQVSTSVGCPHCGSVQAW
jgi:hypothetical protein